MRHEASFTSLSWIPSEAVTGLNKAVFESGFARYDEPPPDRIDDLEALRDADRFRFANVLRAWIEVDEGRITDAGYLGGGLMGSTTVGLGTKRTTFAALSFPDIVRPVDITAEGARFVQTVGGHTALPAPRRVSRPPFVALQAPAVWTTLALVIRPDGSTDHEVVGASTFPRHWCYDATGDLVAKVGLADFKEWWRNSFGGHTPWGDEESPAMVTAVETALERQVAGHIMRGGAKPSYRDLAAGDVLTTEGEPGEDVFLLLNGVMVVEVGGEAVNEIGPGAILGGRAALEGGRRTSTVRAVTRAKVAVVRPDQLDRDALSTINAGQRHEDAAPL